MGCFPIWVAFEPVALGDLLFVGDYLFLTADSLVVDGFGFLFDGFFLVIFIFFPSDIFEVLVGSLGQVKWGGVFLFDAVSFVDRGFFVCLEKFHFFFKLMFVIKWKLFLSPLALGYAKNVEFSQFDYININFYVETKNFLTCSKK